MKTSYLILGIAGITTIAIILKHNNKEVKYKVLQDITAGYVPNATPPKINVVVHKGEIIKGEITEKYIFNQNLKGISIVKNNGSVFISEEFLERI